MKSLRQTIGFPFSSVPPRQRETLLLKNAWICASVIVFLSVNTASLMMFPASKPASVVLTIPVVAGSTAAEALFAPLTEVEAVVETEAVAAAVAGTTVPMTRAETARKQVRSREVLMVFRERGARRDM